MAKKKHERPEAPKRRRGTVQHEELATGTAFTARLKGREFSASVVLGDKGSPEVEFEGIRYPSLSAAGKEHPDHFFVAGPRCISQWVLAVSSRNIDGSPVGNEQFDDFLVACPCGDL